MEVKEMAKFVPRGIIPAMATPTDEWGNINEGALRKLVNHLIDGGVHGLFPIGSQGEFFALTFEQKKKVIEIVIDETRGRVPVYAGTAALTTKEAIETTKMARDLGVDAVSILTPFFTNLNQKEVIQFYLDIARAVPDLPVLLYSNPARTKVPITVETVKELAAVDNIVGIKDSSGDMTLTAEYIRVTRQMDFSVLAGRDTLIYATLCYGGTGSITATANVDPSLVVEIYEAFMAGDHRRALEAQYRLAPLRLAFELGTFPVVIKEALDMIGIEAGQAIRPVGPLTEENRARLRQVLQEMGIVKA
ncbi:4-hydroxy-tetrahydrodipicolinate synthase [Neomoorella humiferrea]|uniref:4-hydroxy-tetrahydrodipicolinate synthase n=1 Tax=Neomoorella humiferrea TaxID=676965 RepID=UPI003D90137E